MPNSLPKAIIFGTGSSGKSLLPVIQEQYQVIAFTDNDKSKWGETFEGYRVCEPESILDLEHDVVIVASSPGLNPITKQLLDMGISRGDIITDYVAISVKSRIVFLEKLADLFQEKGINGCVAEGGVFEGEFAKEINRVFSTSKLYLFDTFSGFDARDISIEKERSFSEFGVRHLAITNENVVLRKLPYPDYCDIRKGFFPERPRGSMKFFVL